MPRKIFTPEQIIRKFRKVEIVIAEGMSANQAVRRIGVSEQRYYRWRKEYGGMQGDQAKRLKALESENIRLKRLVAEKELDIQILKEAMAYDLKKLLSQAKRCRTVQHVCNALAVPERRACKVLEVPRSTHRYEQPVPDDELVLVDRMIQRATKYGRYGTVE